MLTGKGSRIVKLDEFFVDYYQTALAPGELLTGFACRRREAAGRISNLPAQRRGLTPSASPSPERQ
jgi:CO/xanthine dehydrogenase FAD-binding subunit